MCWMREGEELGTHHVELTAWYSLTCILLTCVRTADGPAPPRGVGRDSGRDCGVKGKKRQQQVVARCVYCRCGYVPYLGIKKESTISKARLQRGD